MTAWQNGASLAPWTTLRSGGHAEHFALAKTKDELEAAVQEVHRRRKPLCLLGWGSNVLPSSLGVPGYVLVNQAEEAVVTKEGRIIASSGIGFQQVFLLAAQAGLSGLEFAVGVPGTLGGALVSNAGAYRGNISDLVVELEAVLDGERLTCDPSIMEFSYRDSVLRRQDPPNLVITQVTLQLSRGCPKAIYQLAKQNQKQRISKQPPPPSAGSFFKNVNSHQLAADLAGLPDQLRQAGVVPAGFLIEGVGLKGHRGQGCTFHPKHANFIVNLGGATPEGIRQLADEAKRRVLAEFNVSLEEEALYIGDWSHWDTASGPLS